jgi:hypothetical protein
MRADDSLWFELWCHTRNSGLKEIDEQESDLIERHVSGGVFQLELYNIFKEYQSHKRSVFTLKHLITDPKIIDIRLNEYKKDGIRFTDDNYEKYVEQAMRETHKGILQFEIHMKDFDEKIYNVSIFGQPRLKTDAIHSVLQQQQQQLSSSSLTTTLDNAGTWLAIWWMLENDRRRHRKEYQNSIDREGENQGNYDALTLSNEYEKESAISCKYMPLAYNTDKGREKRHHCLNEHILKPYCQYFISMDNTKSICKPLNALISQLQFPMHRSKMGDGPVCNYWRNSFVETREYASEEERVTDLKIYGFNEKTERHLLLMLNDSLRRHGLSQEVFMREIEHHFSPKNKSDRASHLFLICEEAIAKIGTFAANSTYYTSDYRWIPRKKGKRLYHDALLVVLDSWDNTVLNNIGNSDDCDGMDKIATTVLRSYRIARYDLGFKWQSALLNVVKLYLENRFIYDIGATVTSSYMDTGNGNKDDKDLPLIGSKKDVTANRGGHCYGFIGSRIDGLIRARNGNFDRKKLEKAESLQPQCPHFRKRELSCSIIVLEPTSSIDGRILPTEETCKNHAILYNKCKAERLFIKHLQKELKNQAIDISTMYHPEGQPYYLEEQDPNRCISRFYNEVVQSCSIEMEDLLGPTMSQFTFCSKVNGEWHYGVKIADFIRYPQKCALITPFEGREKEWHQHVRPLMETLQRQQPLMSFGRYSEKDYATIHSTYNHCDDITVEHHFESASDPVRTSERADAFENLIAKVAENPNQTVVRLYSKPWKFQKEKTKTEALKAFLASAPGIIEIGYYSEHHLPICDPIVEILCIVDVKMCHQLE